MENQQNNPESPRIESNQFTKQICYLDPTELTPWKRNARKHSKKQLAQIANSIKEFGFTNPILIDQNKTIIAGHGRVEAAKLLGIDSLPCIHIQHLSDEQKRAYVLADNQIALNSTWDEDLLSQELKALSEIDLA
ncbi:MAG: ParB/Srx family N-terminal domain-containing protein, partial [Proteobacteria bacterium]|nr:ParB/Srx family N-terminal domain-containing protein [Pseudomonadota bacterium]